MLVSYEEFEKDPEPFTEFELKQNPFFNFFLHDVQNQTIDLDTPFVTKIDYQKDILTPYVDKFKH